MNDLLSLLPLNMPIIILGDFNENATAQNNSNLSQLMQHNHFQQFIQVPTTDGGSSLDHIYYNRPEEDNILVDVHDTYYSDHDSIFLTTTIL